MDIKFSKDSEEIQPPVAEDKNRQRATLVALLILVCGVGYVYFFTGLIKPEKQPPPVAAPAPQVVKKPLPPSDGTAKVESPAAPSAAPAAAVTAAAKPEPAKAAVPEPKKAEAVKPAAEPKKADAVKPAAEQKKAEAAKPADKKPLPAVAKVEEKKLVPVEKKPGAVPEKKVQPVIVADTKAAAAKKTSEKADTETAPKKDASKAERKVAVSRDTGGATAGWVVLVGNYVLEEALVADLVRVRKAGLEAGVVAGGQKKTKMTRLLLAECDDRDAAQAQLDKLKRHTSDAFIIDSAGKHSVFAGSYLLDTRAGTEKDRLAAAGFNLSLKRVDVPIASKNLIVGGFSDKKATEETVKKLKDAGINATVIRK